MSLQDVTTIDAQELDFTNEPELFQSIVCGTDDHSDLLDVYNILSNNSIDNDVDPHVSDNETDIFSSFIFHDSSKSIAIDLQNSNDSFFDQNSQLIARETQNEKNSEFKSMAIAEEVIIQKYRCRFCQKLFDSIPDVKSHYNITHNVAVERITLGVKPTTSSINKEVELVNKIDQIDLESKAGVLRSINKNRINYKSLASSTRKDSRCTDGRFFKKTNKLSNFRKFPCDWPDCGYVARHSVHLKDHKKTHTKEKPFECSWESCRLSFSQHSALKMHMRTHTDERPFSCQWPDCRMQFSQKSNLRVHMRTHTGERPYACDWPGCEVRFSTKGNLEQHKKAHLDLKPFVCSYPQCFRKFIERAHLKKHTRVHDPEKWLLSCDWPGCTYRSCRQVDVKNHQVIHTGKKFPCQKCDKMFSRQCHLKKHLKKAHS